jgi:hypothetical protein
VKVEIECGQFRLRLGYLKRLPRIFDEMGAPRRTTPTQAYKEITEPDPNQGRVSEWKRWRKPSG